MCVYIYIFFFFYAIFVQKHVEKSSVRTVEFGARTAYPRVKTQPELSTETHEISRKAFEAEIESPFRRSAE